jgi:hypothetical protein
VWTDVHDFDFSHPFFGEKSHAEVTIFRAISTRISCREIAAFHTDCGKPVDSTAVAIRCCDSRAMTVEWSRAHRDLEHCDAASVDWSTYIRAREHPSAIALRRSSQRTRELSPLA